MKCIGIVGEIEFIKISEVLNGYINSKFNKHKEEVNIILLDNMDLKQKTSFDIVNDKSKITKDIFLGINEIKILMLNIDDKNKYYNDSKLNFALITYGMSSKACVTLSSVVEDSVKTMQFCIMRTINTLDKNKVYEQEFSIKFEKDYIENEYILAGVTACIACGIDIS
jgi:hypothetical protein